MDSIAVEQTMSKEAKSVREQVGEEEWKVRVDLAACYRLMAKLGMTDLVYNHITAKVPGAAEQFLINAYGLMYTEVTASNLYKIDLAGNVVLGPKDLEGDHGVNKAGFVIHSSVHRARPDIGCIIHTHTRAGVAVSAMDCGLLPLSQFSMFFHGNMAYHDYGVPAQAEEGKQMVQSLGEKNWMILRNHGLLICGATVAEAFRANYWIEQACKIQVDVMTAGTKMRLPSDEVVAAMTASGARKRPGQMEWAAMLRMLNREDPGYRD